MTRYHITDDAVKGIEQGLPTVEIPVTVYIEPLSSGEGGIGVVTNANGMAMLLQGLYEAGGRFQTLGVVIAEQLSSKYSK